MLRSLFSVSYAGLWGQKALDLQGFVGKAGTLGYDAVMVAGKRPHLSPLDATPEVLDSVKAGMGKSGVSCAVIAGYTDFSGGAAPEVPVIEMQIAYVESLANTAAALGAKVVRVFTAYHSTGEPLTVVWNRVVAALQECSDRCADKGVTLAVQNHHDVGVHTDVLLELIAEVGRDNCKLGFDAWSPHLRGEDLYEAAKKAAPFTAITTNADYVRQQRFSYDSGLINYQRVEPDSVKAVPFGTGGIDYKGFFKGLREGGFDGIATYEMCSPLRGGGSEENLDACATAYLDWMSENGY